MNASGDENIKKNKKKKNEDEKIMDESPRSTESEK